MLNLKTEKNVITCDMVWLKKAWGNQKNIKGINIVDKWVQVKHWFTAVHCNLGLNSFECWDSSIYIAILLWIIYNSNLKNRGQNWRDITAWNCWNCLNISSYVRQKGLVNIWRSVESAGSYWKTIMERCYSEGIWSYQRTKFHRIKDLLVINMLSREKDSVHWARLVALGI